MQTTPNIEITHNPFTVQTEIRVDGRLPDDSSPLSSYEKQRLQRWVESLFDNLRDVFNGCKKFRLRFTGVESDWLDIEEAAKKARDDGMEIALEHAPFARNGEERLKELIALKEEASGFLDLEDADFKRIFAEALDKNFDVFVVATMSSGKSTLLNAILGVDLLPAANEATTAVLAEIHCDGHAREGVFRGRCETEKGVLIEETDMATKDILSRWNGDTEDKYKDVFRIRLKGKIAGIQEREHVRLVLTDTPGPNNSQSEEHRKTTMMGIQAEGKQPLIVYVLNGTQLGTDDDKRLLGLVSDAMKAGGKQAKDRFLFVANKMDSFDPEKENVSGALRRVRVYLKENGISHPLIYPVTARLAYLLRKDKAAQERGDAGRLTRDEQGELNKLKFTFDVDVKETQDMDMEQHMQQQLSSRVKKKLEDRNLSLLLRRSGVPALESLIDGYIDKYSLPYRVSRAYDALVSAIGKASHKAELEKVLKLTRKELEKTKAALHDLETRKGKGFDVKTYLGKRKRENKGMPDAVRERLMAIQQERVPLFRQLNDELTGVAPSDAARERLSKASEELHFLHLRLSNAYENEFKRAQEEIQAELRVEYEKHLQSLFPESTGLDLPVLAGIKQMLGDLSLDLDVREQDIEIEDVYENRRFTRRVENRNRAWYKPWTWLDDKYVSETVEEKVKVGAKEMVNLETLWVERKGEVETAFREMLDAAQKEIDSGHKKLIEKFLDFMTGQFEPSFDRLVKDIDAKLADQKLREESIAKAEEQLERIQAFEKRLASVLEVQTH
jgi:hypothetical protein